MTVEENLRVSAEAVEALNSRNWKRFEELHGADVVAFSNESQPTKGVAEHRTYVEGFVTAFPDLKMRRIRAFGQGDWITEEWEATGTHTGPLTGPGDRTVPPRGKKVKLGMCSKARLHNGKLIEEHTYMDLLSLMSQVGAFPPAPAKQ